MADNLDGETRQAILSESVKVFELNNSVIRSVEGINKVLLRRFFKFFIAVMLLLFFFFAFFFQNRNRDRV